MVWCKEKSMTEKERTARIQARVQSLLESNEISCFIGYEAGATPLLISPAFVQDVDEVARLVWNVLAINNLATYLKRFRNEKIGVLVKGCDSRSIVELLKLHQIQREQVHIIGVPCRGIVDSKKIAQYGDPASVLAIRDEGEQVVVERANAEPLTIDKEALLYEKCLSCAYPTPLIYDELIDEAVPPRGVTPEVKFAEVERLEQLDVTDRLSFWSEEFSKCIRCYACKNVCPMCFCTECLWEKRDPQWVTKYQNPDDVFSFHLIRAYHMVGRCTGCMECERVCPVDIPLGRLFQKVEKDCLELFEYMPGVDEEATPPLSTFEEGDHAHEDLLR